jgi:hypothetical protein
MGVSDIIFDSMIEIIDGCHNYYDESELLDMAENELIVEVIACHLKVTHRGDYYRPTPEDLARIEATDWKKKAKKYIIEYLKETYL